MIALVVLGAVGAMVGGVVVWSASRPAAVVAGPYRAEEVARVATGHQRAERLTFLDGGKLLAATCPRYDRVMLYRVTAGNGLDLVADIPVGGRPVALAAGPDRLYVLARPANDARHVDEGWWEAFDFRGQSLTPKRRVGLYPDDFALAGPPESPHLLVLTSGRGEGDPGRPPAALTVYDLDVGSANPGIMARVDFPGADDLGRLALAPDGRTAAVSVVGPRSAVVWLDVADLAAPRAITRRPWPESSRPDALRFDEDGALLVTDDGNDLLWRQARADVAPTSRDVDGGAGDVAPIRLAGRPAYWAYTLPFDSGLALLAADAPPAQAPARLPLLGGRLKLAATRPVGLAVEPARGLIAVANRSGGSVHLVALTPAAPR